MTFLRRAGGGATITTQKITFLDTVREIVFFTILYSLAGVIQVGILGTTTVLLGRLAGPVFLALAMGLSFSPHLILTTRPFTVGLAFRLRYENERRPPGHVVLAQAMLGIAGVLALGAVVTSHLPEMWQWRLTWTTENGYVIMSRFWPWGWHMASNAEVAVRVMATFVVPFVGWSSALLLKWAAQMEVVRPTFRETTHRPIDPSTIEGPMGEEYRSPDSRGDDGGGAVVVMPDY